MSAGSVDLAVQGNVATMLFNRPDAHNAMTWTMYEQLAAHCEALATDREVRVVVLRGVGGKAFVAGTDIEQFRAFESGESGIAYERGIDACIGLLERLPMSTVAVVEGWCMGGGLAIAAACDFRLAAPGAKFGIPIARTLGNCLSAANTARVVTALGQAMAKRVLMAAETVSAEQCLAAGFVQELAEGAALDASVAALCTRLASLAPLTQHACKETIRRLAEAGLPDTDDLIRLCYGSADFREGIASFLEKRPPRWSGR